MLTPRGRARDRLWAPTPGRIEMLVTLSEALSSGGLSGEAALQESATVLAEVLGDAIMIFRVSDGLRWLEPVAWHHVEEAGRAVLAGMQSWRFRADRGFSGGVLESGRGVLVPCVTTLEVEVLQPEIEPFCTALGMRGFVLAPLVFGGRTLGLVAQARTRPAPRLCADDRAFLEEVGLRLAQGLVSRGESA